MRSKRCLDSQTIVIFDDFVCEKKSKKKNY